MSLAVFRRSRPESCPCGRSPEHYKAHCPRLLSLESDTLGLALADPAESFDYAVHLIAESFR